MDREAITLACTDPNELWRTILDERRPAEPELLPLMDRWQRLHSMGLGADRSNFLDAVDGESALARRREQHSELGRIADRTVPQLGGYFAERDYKVVVTDTEGVVIRSWGGGRFSSIARELRFIDGSHWAESVRGTNAVGVVLAERRPAAVIGAAHYERIVQVAVCYAAPIFDAKGEMIGVVDASSELRDADPFAMIAVCSLARAFEHATIQRQTTRHVVDILDRVACAALVVERTGKVVSINETAARLLVLPRRRAEGALVEDVLGVSWLALLRAVGGGPLRVSLPGSGARRAELMVHVDPAFETGREVDVLTLRLEAFSSPTRARREASPSRPPSGDPFAEIFGTDEAVIAVKRTAGLFARSKVPILILSETGTGKELLAHAVHRASDRADRAFVAINCGAISENLLATELFGYASGAFSGAQRGGSEGKLAMADGGTLFLDEIAEMPASLQAMLLRVLENGSYYRVGDNQPRSADIRLVCATCRDLRALVAEGRFRDDLSYRIKGAVLSLPPLRARRDIAALASHLLDDLIQEARCAPRRFAPEVIALLERYRWPGNVRELKAALQYALVVADGPEIRLEHLPQELTAADAPMQPAADVAERSLVERAMTEARGKVDEAASRLGISRATLYRKLKRLGR